MKNLYKALLISLLGFIFCDSIKANNLIFTYDSTNKIIRYFKITSSGGNTNYESITQNSNLNWDSSKIFFDSENQKVYQYETSSNYWQVYDLSTGEWSNETDVGNTGGHSPTTLPIGATSLVSKSNGTISIGENSLKLKETATTQEMWATNSSGSIAPINITNGTKLLINGRDVEQSIDNVGALSAALTALPTVPTDSPIACGFGTGTHSGNYAFSGGCASKVNEKLSFNAAASFVPGQDYQGTDNSYSARAGFVFKLGKTSNKEFISKKEKQLDQKVSNLQTENKELKSLIAKQNERLEKLEEIALALKLRNDLEVISMAE